MVMLRTASRANPVDSAVASVGPAVEINCAAGPAPEPGPEAPYPCWRLAPWIPGCRRHTAHPEGALKKQRSLSSMLILPQVTGAPVGVILLPGAVFPIAVFCPVAIFAVAIPVIAVAIASTLLVGRPLMT